MEFLMSSTVKKQLNKIMKGDYSWGDCPVQAKSGSLVVCRSEDCPVFHLHLNTSMSCGEVANMFLRSCKIDEYATGIRICISPKEKTLLEAVSIKAWSWRFCKDHYRRDNINGCGNKNCPISMLPCLYQADCSEYAKWILEHSEVVPKKESGSSWNGMPEVVNKQVPLQLEKCAIENTERKYTAGEINVSEVCMEAAERICHLERAADDALTLLDEMNASGEIPYDVYCRLFDAFRGGNNKT